MHGIVIYAIFAVSNIFMYQMEKQETLPRTVVVAAEFEQETFRIRSIIRNAQDAFARLRDDENFVMPDKLSDLTVEYCKEYFNPIRQKISDMVINEDDPSDVLRKKKLSDRWERRQSEGTRLINIVRTFLDMADLAPRYDQMTRNIVPGASVADIAARRVERQVPPMAADHWRMLQHLASTYREFRRFEADHNIKKTPLVSLLSLDAQRFCEIWATGEAVIPADEPITIKAMREAKAKTFV